MKYVADLFERYTTAFGNATGALNYKNYLNSGLFAAGIALNNASYKKAAASASNLKVELYKKSTVNFADMELKYKDQSFNFGFSTFIDENAKYIAPPPMMSFNRTKNISITEIDGDGGEVVENYGLKNWDIDFEGLIIDTEEHLYPQKQISIIAQLFEINDIIEVSCTLLQDLGIYSIWLRDQSITPLEGFTDTFKYSFKARSIKPAEFSILNGN